MSDAGELLNAGKAAEVTGINRNAGDKITARLRVEGTIDSPE